jgi:hypothetical protein
MKRSLVTAVVGSIIVLRENQNTPTDRDWDDFLQILREHRANNERVRILVVTDGGGPSSAQRKRLEEALGGRSFRVSVVTDSAKVRFIVSSIALLNRDIKTFSKAEIKGAFEHLRLDPTDQETAKNEIRKLERDLDPEAGTK